MPPKATNSFWALKPTLLKFPSLNDSNPSDRFYLWTDASRCPLDKDGKPISGMIGWELTQLASDRKYMPISFFFSVRSKKSHPQQKMTTIQMEKIKIVNQQSANNQQATK